MRACRLALLALLVVQGCEQQQDPGTTFVGGPYPITMHQVYATDEPSALMTLEYSLSGKPTGGRLIGRLHGWPFAHADSSGDPGEGLFTYRIDFVVTGTKKGDPNLPTAASGRRLVYFHQERGIPSFDRTVDFSEGQVIIQDASELSFSFDSGNKEVKVAINSHQTGARPFSWDGAMVSPPDRRGPETAMMTGSYSAAYRGYLLQ